MIGITCTYVHAFQLIDICATVSSNYIHVMSPLHTIKVILDKKTAGTN